MTGRILLRNIREIAGSTLTTSFQNFGLPITCPAYKISIVNASTTDIQVQDETNQDAFYIIAGTSMSIAEGLSGYGQDEDTRAISPNRTQYLIKLPSGVAGTGNIVLTVLGWYNGNS
jgi:hypothetical protein